MKQVYFILLLCCFSLFAYSVSNDIDNIGDFLSEEDCMRIDSLFTLYSLVTIDSVLDNSTQEQPSRSSIDYSYQTTFYIAQNPTLVYKIGRILILCESATYDSLATEIIRYAKDIHNAYGCAVLVYSINGGTYSDIKELIKDNYEPDDPFLSGAVLIGNIPCAKFYHPTYHDAKTNTNWESETFPCDYYYMDLDGVWSDEDGNGSFDQHTGNIKPEIFVGRIQLNYQSDKIKLMRAYFDRNHQYWMGERVVNKKRGLSFTDKDWRGIEEFRVAIQQLYGEENTDSIQGELFSKTKYLNAIEDEVYEFIQFACHSNVTYHTTDTTTSPITKVTSTELRRKNIQTLGYNLFCCKACRWDQGGVMSLGEAYLFGYNTKTLSIVGSTKTGGMTDGMKTFYNYLGEGDCMGTAYRIWWKDVVSKINDVGRRYRWYYGMCILGDPMINFLYDNQCNEEVNISSWNQNNTSDKHIYYAQEEIAASCTIPHNKTLELHANSVRLTDGFYAPAGSSLHISVESCYDNNVSPKKINKRNETTTVETAVETITTTAEIQVYPNPCSTIISINGVTENKIRYKIYDMNGLLVNSGFNNGQNIDVSTLPAGLYNLIVEDAHGNIKANGLKIIKQ